MVNEVEPTSDNFNVYLSIFEKSLAELKQSKKRNESDEIIALRLRELYECWGLLLDSGNSIEDFGQFRLWEQEINSAVSAAHNNVNTYFAKTDPNQQHSRYACFEEKASLRSSLISLNKLIKKISPPNINTAENPYEIAGDDEPVGAMSDDDGIYDMPDDVLYDKVADDNRSEMVDGLYTKVMGKACGNESDGDSGCATPPSGESENGYLTPISANAISDSDAKKDFSYAMYFVKNDIFGEGNYFGINPFFLRRITKFFTDTVNRAEIITQPEISDINPRYSVVNFVTINDNLLADLKRLQSVLKQANEQSMNFIDCYSKMQKKALAASKEAALEFAESRAIELLFDAVADGTSEYYLQERHKQHFCPKELKSLFKQNCVGTFNDGKRGEIRKFGLENLVAAISKIKENTDNESILRVKFIDENKQYKLELQKTTEEKRITVLLSENFENLYNNIKKARSQAPLRATELLINFLCDRNGQARPDRDVSFGEKRVVKETLVGEKIFNLMAVEISILKLLVKDTSQLSVEINQNTDGQYVFRLKNSEDAIVEEPLPASGAKFLEKTVPQPMLKEQPKEIANNATPLAQEPKSKKNNKGVKVLKSLANKVRQRSKSESATKQKPMTDKKRTASDSECGRLTPIGAECDADVYEVEVVDKSSEKPLPPLPGFFSAVNRRLRTVSDSVASTAQVQQALVNKQRAISDPEQSAQRNQSIDVPPPLPPRNRKLTP